MGRDFTDFVEGLESWPGDALDELTADCYVDLFVKRLHSLKAQLRTKPRIEGLVFLGIRNFLHERQKYHDPVGFRVFEALRLPMAPYEHPSAHLCFSSGQYSHSSAHMILSSGQNSLASAHLIFSSGQNILPPAHLILSSGQSSLSSTCLESSSGQR